MNLYVTSSPVLTTTWATAVLKILAPTGICLFPTPWWWSPSAWYLRFFLPVLLQARSLCPSLASNSLSIWENLLVSHLMKVFTWIWTPSALSRWRAKHPYGWLSWRRFYIHWYLPPIALLTIFALVFRSGRKLRASSSLTCKRLLRLINYSADIASFFSTEAQDLGSSVSLRHQSKRTHPFQLRISSAYHQVLSCVWIS